MKQIESGAFVVRVSETPGAFTVLRGHSVVARGSYIAGNLKLQQTGGDCPSKGAVIEALERMAGTYVAVPGKGLLNSLAMDLGEFNGLKKYLRYVVPLSIIAVSLAVKTVTGTYPTRMTI